MSDLAGKNLGPYRIIEQLGMGGMATVYKAYQPNMDRTVAVKILPRHFAQDPTFVGRFEQEARTIAKLEHARILPVYDYGEEDGITYIVMRYLDAGTLSRLIERGPLSPEQAARIIKQLSEGLDYAHSRGVIHRDIKPSNIMLDSSGDAYITDFGIAKLVEGTAQFTGSGMIGTPAYVSPEQGLGQPIDHRSDIYALGVVLYEMLTGQQPYNAETPMAVVIKHINEPLPMPRLINPNIPDLVELVILKSLAKKPEDRFESCGEMAEALDKALKGKSMPAPTVVEDQTASPAVTIPVAPAVPVPSAPMTKASPFVDDGGTQPLSTTQALPKKKTNWVLIFGAIGGLILLCIIGVLLMALLSSFSDAADDDGNDVPVADATLPDQGKAGPPDQQEKGNGPPTPGEGFGQPGSGPAAGLPAGELILSEDAFDCLPGQEPALFREFGPDDTIPPGGSIELAPDSEDVFLLRAQAAPQPFFMELGSFPAQATTFKAFFLLVDSSTHFSLRSRTNGPPEPGQPPDGYAAMITGDGGAQIARQGDPFGEWASIHSINDNLPHTLALHVEGDMIGLYLDGLLITSVVDPDPLEGNTYMVEVLQGEVVFGAFLVCSGSIAESTSPSDGEAPGEVTFEDAFDDPHLDTTAWSPHNLPQDAWGMVDGRLMIPVLSFTGPGTVEDADPLPAVLFQAEELNVKLGEKTGVVVEVDITPTENYQGAGLVVFNLAREPLMTLFRAYCDTEDYCQGDAIYFNNWSALAGQFTDEPSHVAGAGTLPHGEPVFLRLVHGQNVLRAHFRLPGETVWHEVGSWPIIEKQFGGIGLGTFSGGEEVSPIEAFFDNFIVFAGE